MRFSWKKWVTDMGNRLTGAGMVYRFTLQQIMKSKSNRVVFGILMAAAALTIPVAGLFLGSRGGGEVSSYVDVSTVEEYLNGGRVGFDTRHGIQYGYSIVAMIICVFSVTYIVRAIVEEKVSRLVETLMVSVRPMALVLGKILAVMTFMFTMLLAVLGVFALSYTISGRLMDVSFVSHLLASMGISMELLRLGPGALLVALVSLVLVYSGAGCLNYLVAKGFFDTIPRALDEAALLDGASRNTVFWKITLPNSKPIVVYTAITAFIAPWVDFIFVSVIMKDDYQNYTVALGLYRMLEREHIYNYFTQFCAGAVLVAIPITLLFIKIQKFYVEGVTSGAVKG